MAQRDRVTRGRGPVGLSGPDEPEASPFVEGYRTPEVISHLKREVDITGGRPPCGAPHESARHALAPPLRDYEETAKFR